MKERTKKGLTDEELLKVVSLLVERVYRLEGGLGATLMLGSPESLDKAIDESVWDELKKALEE